MTASTAALLAFAERLADVSRPLLQQAFRRPVAVDTKADDSPVTAADRAVEAALRAQIERHRPDDGVLGEELGADGLDREYVWVLDPIDGTKAFASGNPLFGTLIGLLHRGVPVLGVLDAPALGERYRAANGLGAWRDNEPLSTRTVAGVTDAVVYTTEPDLLEAHPGCRELRRRARWSCFGGDCLAYAWLAAGSCDVIVDRGLGPHDWCALVPIVHEAGGEMADWRGEPLTLASGGDVVAAGTPTLGGRVRALLHR